MPTLARTAFGTKLSFNSQDIPELTNLTNVGGTTTVIDVTAHDGSNSFGSKIPTFIDGGQVTATMNYVPGNAAQGAFKTAWLAKTSSPCVVTWPTTGNPTVTFNAFVTQHRVPGAPVGGALVLEVQLTVDGAVTFS